MNNEGEGIIDEKIIVDRPLVIMMNTNTIITPGGTGDSRAAPVGPPGPVGSPWGPPPGTDMSALSADMSALSTDISALSANISALGADISALSRRIGAEQ